MWHAISRPDPEMMRALRRETKRDEVDHGIVTRRYWSIGPRLFREDVQNGSWEEHGVAQGEGNATE